VKSLFIGSGNIVHALRLARAGGGAYDWAQEFDAVTAVAIRDRDLGTLLRPTSAAARLSVPTDDHYRPMLAALSLVDPDERLRFFNNSIDLGSIGMRSFLTV
jgi:4,5-DOPA dioxygenase extradiol